MTCVSGLAIGYRFRSCTVTPALQFALHGVGAETGLNLQDLGEFLFYTFWGFTSTIRWGR